MATAAAASSTEPPGTVNAEPQFLAAEIDGQVVPLSQVTPDMLARIMLGLAANEQDLADRWGVVSAAFADSDSGSVMDPTCLDTTTNWFVDPPFSLENAGFEPVPDDA